jgi:hypothetical protein
MLELLSTFFLTKSFTMVLLVRSKKLRHVILNYVTTAYEATTWKPLVKIIYY